MSHMPSTSHWTRTNVSTTNTRKRYDRPWSIRHWSKAWTRVSRILMDWLEKVEKPTIPLSFYERQRRTCRRIVLTGKLHTQNHPLNSAVKAPPYEGGNSWNWWSSLAWCQPPYKRNDTIVEKTSSHYPRNGGIKNTRQFSSIDGISFMPFTETDRKSFQRTQPFWNMPK